MYRRRGPGSRRQAARGAPGLKIDAVGAATRLTKAPSLAREPTVSEVMVAPESSANLAPIVGLTLPLSRPPSARLVEPVLPKL